MSTSTAECFNSPATVMQIMTQLNEMVDEHDDSSSRRMLGRREIVFPVLIQFLDENKLPCSNTTAGVSLDVSFAGISFLIPGEIPEGAYALIQYTESLGQHPPIVVEVRNKYMIGPFCRVRGRFEVNWNRSENPQD